MTDDEQLEADVISLMRRVSEVGTERAPAVARVVVEDGTAMFLAKDGSLIAMMPEQAYREWCSERAGQDV